MRTQTQTQASDANLTPIVVANSTDLLSSRADLLRRAQSRTPTTAEDLPIGFYRVDLLPISDEHANIGDNTSKDPDIGPDGKGAARQIGEVQALKAAYVELSYEYGYPTLPSGEPFWHKLDYEPGVAYGAFQIFLDLGLQGARELSTLAQNGELKRVLQSYRHNGDAAIEITHAEILRELTEFHILYYWKARSKAYDLFQEAAYRHIRIKRAMNAEDYHYTMSERLLKVVETYLASKDFEQGLTPKVAIEALTKLVAIQRVSAGLPAAGPLQAKDATPTTQFEAILRELGVRQAQAVPQGTQNHQRSAALSTMLRDPSTVKTMQELIIRVTTTGLQDQDQDQSQSSRGDEGRTFEHDLAEDIAFHKDA